MTGVCLGQQFDTAFLPINLNHPNQSKPGQ